MGEIVELRAEMPVWRCKCGCLTFFLNANSTVECVACREISSSEDDGAWRLRLPEKPPLLRETVEPNDTTIASANDPEWALKRVLNAAKYKTTAFVLVVQNDGETRVWGEKIETPEEEAWFMRRCNAALNILK